MTDRKPEMPGQVRLARHPNMVDWATDPNGAPYIRADIADELRSDLTKARQAVQNGARMACRARSERDRERELRREADAALAASEAALERAEGALAFYADEANYNEFYPDNIFRSPGRVHHDRGAIARAALATGEGER